MKRRKTNACAQMDQIEVVSGAEVRERVENWSNTVRCEERGVKAQFQTPHSVQSLITRRFITVSRYCLEGGY